MGLAVTTVAAGGLPIRDLAGPGGIAVTEVTKFGLAVTKVTGAGGGMGVTFVNADGSSIPAVTYTTFDITTATGGEITLSNGNLTATHSGSTSNRGVRSSVTKNTGKYYFELTVGATAGGDNSLGIMSSTGTYANFVSGATDGTLVRCTGGIIWANGTDTTKALGNIVAGNVIGIAVDLNTRKMWFQKNGGNWNGDPTHNPNTPAGGVTVHATNLHSPCVGFASSSLNNVVTANFGASAFVGTVPSGFTSGWPV